MTSHNSTRTDEAPKRPQRLNPLLDKPKQTGFQTAAMVYAIIAGIGGVFGFVTVCQPGTSDQITFSVLACIVGLAFSAWLLKTFANLVSRLVGDVSRVREIEEYHADVLAWRIREEQAVEEQIETTQEAAVSNS